MDVTFLGTNGWYDTATGNTVAAFIETDERYVILDAGFGFYKARALITSEKPVALFISHLHLDHIIGLHTLPLFRLSQGIDIYAPKRELAAIRGFLKRPFTSPPLLLTTKLRFREAVARSRGEIAYSMARMRHSVPCYGYRFEFSGKAVTYCTDTGDCANTKGLARGTDLFITECSMAPGDRSPNLFHITPETAGRIAVGAGARKLVLTHFDPGTYPTLESRRAAERAAQAVFTNTVAARDAMTIGF